MTTANVIRPARARPLTQTAAYYLSFVALGLVVASLGPTLPALASLTHAPLREISFLFTARAFGYLVGSLLGGRLYDRTAGHPLMATVLAVMAAMLVLVPFAAWLWLLTLVLWLLGMAEGVLDVGGNTLLVWVHRERVGPFMNALHFFFGVGAFLSPIIVAQVLLASGGSLWAYWVLAALLLPSVVWFARLPSPSAQQPARTGDGVRVNRLLVLLIALFFFVYAGAEAGFGGWVFTYAVARNLANETLAAYLTSTFWGALTLGRLLAIPIAAHVRPHIIIFADLLGGLLSVAVIALGADSVALTWLGTFGLGLAMASIFPTTLAFAERRMNISGQITGWFFVGSSAGGMFFPWLIGQGFESAGAQVVVWVVGASVLAALLLFALLSAQSRVIEM